MKQPYELQPKAVQFNNFFFYNSRENNGDSFIGENFNFKLYVDNNGVFEEENIGPEALRKAYKLWYDEMTESSDTHVVNIVDPYITNGKSPYKYTKRKGVEYYNSEYHIFGNNNWFANSAIFQIAGRNIRLKIRSSSMPIKNLKLEYYPLCKTDRIYFETSIFSRQEDMIYFAESLPTVPADEFGQHTIEAPSTMLHIDVLRPILAAKDWNLVLYETSSPTATEQPGAMEEPTATEQPGAMEEPTATEQPGAMEEPTATEQPGAMEEPTATEQPGAMEEPTATEQPGASE